MALNLQSLLLGAFLLLLVTQPFIAESRTLKPTQSFKFLQNLEGCHKGQTVKGLHQLKKYLEKFGYLNYGDSKKNNLTHANDDEFDDILEAAMKAYQKNYHLKVTGNLDHDTVKEMMIPRCGVPDVINGTTSKAKDKMKHDHRYKKFHMVSHFEFFPGMPRWPPTKTRLTYNFRSSAQVVGVQELRSVCTRAFQRWADVSHFTFQEAPEGTKADIEIGFHRRSHGDNAPFDGPGDTLAHAFIPQIGWFHYDADENWSTNPGMNEVDLESVAVHEIGHLLGLDHTPIPEAIMYAKFSFGTIKRDLHPDDIDGIRALYST